MQALKESSKYARSVVRAAAFLRASRVACLAICGVIGMAGPAHAYDPLDFVPEQVPAARLSGAATMHRYGQAVYAVKLFIDPGSFSPEDLTRESFALDFEYVKPCTGQGVADSVRTQMADMGIAATPQIQAWYERLRTLLPDLRAADHLTAVFQPQHGTRFYRNGEPFGAVPGQAFARAYFGIWLNPASTVPGLRAQLMQGSH
ncbi:chalcone isomerase family protein [Robbsia sp. Bb-Pol-6]|uniref:Chalcone isomerase family protein n=1 Tax=Robbsia betulipollinis TaxID=2981849 RepID=A0ABT3ZRA3_9BURK|nr:chalcone isomerase family protein [Robbsia betulipollinis]MCY0389078.1 chalcone isomerase family protein [Robbsia betulipollinis]